MAFCKNCGKQLPEGATFCPACGTSATEQTQQANTQFQQTTAMYPSNPDKADAEQNKVMAVLSYFGILVLIPIFAAKESKFARFHASQGLMLLLTEVAYYIAKFIIELVLGLIFPLDYNYLLGYYTHGAIYSIISGILGLASILFLVLAIIGIVNAVQGNKKELPIIGKIDILSKFMKN